MFLDRRKERSSVPWQAAGFYLKQLAKRSGFDQLVLASQEGFLLAGIGQSESNAHIAAFASMAAENPCVTQSKLGQRIFQGEPLQVWPVQIAHRPCYLAAPGHSKKLTENAGQVLNRIFQQFSNS